MNVKINDKGAIVLGKRVSCDGFLNNKGFRVQTHVHEDHMRSFNSSLGYQEGVILTKPTLDLISIIKNKPDLDCRNNIHVVEGNQSKRLDGFRVDFLDSGHMLGSVQVAVEYDNGLKLGYSGDFGWPLDNIIQVDELVIDSTYGLPESVRSFSQDYIEECLLELVNEYLTANPVYIISHRGTIQRALKCLNQNINVPVIVSKKLLKEIEVFNKYGYGIINCFLPFSNEGQDIMKEGKYIRFYGTGDILPNDTSGYTCINLKAIFGRNPEPVINHGNNSFTIPYSNHADFDETLEYVYSTNAKKVLTDPIRSSYKNAKELAWEIKKRLKIDATTYHPISSSYWGE